MSDIYAPSDGWMPYVVDGKAHPGVLIEAAGMAKDDGHSFLAYISPEGHTNPHIHSGDEIVEVQQGVAEIAVDGWTMFLHAGITIKILSGTVHSIRNSTADVLCVRATFDPPFRQQVTTLVS